MHPDMDVRVLEVKPLQRGNEIHSPEVRCGHTSVPYKTRAARAGKRGAGKLA